MPNARVTIQISAPEHSGKTSLIVLLAKHLESLGAAKVTVQHADPQLSAKLSLDESTLIDRLKTMEITLTEMQTRGARHV